MSLHISLNYQGNPCSFDLIEGSQSENSIINGVNYNLIADQAQLEIAAKILGAVSAKPLSSEQKLVGRIKKLAETEEVTVSHLWKQEEDKNLARTIRCVAQTYWNSRDNRNHDALKKFLGKTEEFDQAIQEENFDAFLALFSGISADELWNIRNNENCQPLGFVKSEPYAITAEDLKNLQDYLDDIGFSGVVSLSDQNTCYSICPTKLGALERVPFSMHSISKVLTGVLALMTMPAESFLEPLHLDPDLVASLEKPLQEHLKRSTLLQTMNHLGGFGDYLHEYQQALLAGLKREPLSNTMKLEDFLKYAETKTYPLNQDHYSNLGILFVSLAIQHQVGKPFDQLLQELILTPANVTISATKPENGKYNLNDPCQGLVVGSPAGGHWITAQDLLRLGNWLHDKCKSEPSRNGGEKESQAYFLSLMEQFGTEFYIPEDKEIRHNGCSGSGSSFLSTFLESGVTISILSDQDNFMANRLYYTIREKMIEQKD